MHRYCLQDRNFIIIFAIVRSLCVWFYGCKTMNLLEPSILSPVKFIVSLSLSPLRERGWGTRLCRWNKFKYVQLLSAGSFHVACWWAVLMCDLTSNHPTCEKVGKMTLFTIPVFTPTYGHEHAHRKGKGSHICGPPKIGVYATSRVRMILSPPRPVAYKCGNL